MKYRFVPALLLGLFCLSGEAKAQTYGTPYHLLSGATNNSTSVVAGKSYLCGALVITNLGSTTGLDLRFYDSATAPTCSSATGVVLNIAIPVNATAANIAGISIPLPSLIKFTNGLGFCLTGAVADNDNTNAVVGVQVNFGYGS